MAFSFKPTPKAKIEVDASYEFPNYEFLNYEMPGVEPQPDHEIKFKEKMSVKNAKPEEKYIDLTEGSDGVFRPKSER